MLEGLDRILAVGAHPDDSDGFAGLFFRLKGLYDLHIADFTHGERGCGRERFLDGWAGRTRTREEHLACALLGATPHFCDEIDGEACAPRETCRRLADLITKLKPRAIFTHWPVDHHFDHVMTAAAVCNAIRMTGWTGEFYFFEACLEQTGNMAPSYWVDISPVVQNKLEFLRTYACQNANDWLAVQALERGGIRGAQCSPAVKYAEAFATMDGRPIKGGILDSVSVSVKDTGLTFK